MLQISTNSKRVIILRGSARNYPDLGIRFDWRLCSGFGRGRLRNLGDNQS